MTSREAQYNASTLDKQRIIQYARKVAKTIAGVVPMETFQRYTSVQREEVQRTGWFSRKRVTLMSRTPRGNPVRYWEVGRLVGKLERKREGISVYGHGQQRWNGIEDGALIVLLADGELRYVDYKVYTSGEAYPNLKIGDLHTDWKMSPMRDGDFLMLDRTNFGRARERTFQTKEGVLYSEELQLDFRVTADHKGQGLLLALDRLGNSPLELRPTNASAASRASVAHQPAAQPKPMPPRSTQAPTVDRTSRRLDMTVLAGFLVLAATVLVPWLLGRFLLRDSRLFERNPAVFDESVRSVGQYFLTDYFGGLLIPGLITAAILIARPWRGRKVFGVLGVILAAGLLVTTLLARSWWNTHEKESAEFLRTQAYPFSQESYCNGRGTAAKFVNGVVFSAGVGNQRGPTTSGIVYCDTIQIYHGWKRVGQIPLAAGADVRSTFSYPGHQGDPGWIVAVVNVEGSAGYLLGVALDWPATRWQQTINASGTTDGSDANVIRLGNTLMVIEEVPGKPDLRHPKGVDMSTGSVAWTFACPPVYTAFKFKRGGWNGQDKNEIVCWNDRHTATYSVGDDGSAPLLR